MRYVYWSDVVDNKIIYEGADAFLSAVKEEKKHTLEEFKEDQNKFRLGTEILLSAVVDTVCRDRGIEHLDEGIRYSSSRGTKEVWVAAQFCFSSDDDALIFFLSVPAGKVSFTKEEIFNAR